MEDHSFEKPHTLFLEDRKKMDITGVTDAQSFDEDNLSIETVCGKLIVKGENLQVTRLSLETGDLSVEGNILSVHYSAVPQKPAGFFGKVFG